jgi:hypothetical protein
LLQSAFQRINGVRAIQDSTVSSLCTK